MKRLLFCVKDFVMISGGTRFTEGESYRIHRYPLSDSGTFTLINNGGYAHYMSVSMVREYFVI